MKDYNCNACDNGNCNGDVIRDKRGNFFKSVPCKGYKVLRPMRVKLPDTEGKKPTVFGGK